MYGGRDLKFFFLLCLYLSGIDLSAASKRLLATNLLGTLIGIYSGKSLLNKFQLALLRLYVLFELS